jgi:nicotinate-nucleotide adenylyltransferase
MNLGIMGGTFNPVHYGHLFAAQEARFSFGLDEVLFIPNRTPPHKMHDREIADAEDRYAMTCLATFSNPFFRVSRLEVDRTSISYTSETIETLRGLFPHADLFLITGADGLIRYEWHDFDRLIDMLYCFVVVSRPGSSLEDLADSCRKLSERHRHKIKYLEIPCLDISSTDIRKRLGEGKPITYMVPEEVEKYIFKHGLYIG